MKKIYFPALLLALATMVGCAEDESQVVGGVASSGDNGDLVSINVYAGTTKGTDTTTDTLEDKGEVVIHINDSGTVNETYKFTCENSDWSQSGSSLLWNDITFPANFYSLFDTEALTSLTFNNDDAIYSNYSVAMESTDHKDLVYHASTLDAIPSSSMVSVHHKHALSKINFYVSTGSINVYIARVQMVNVDDTGTVTITPLAADASSTTVNAVWKDNTTFNSTYQYYYVGANDATTAFNSATYGGDTIINNATNAPMMIIPQSTTAATITEDANGGADATISDTYVEVIYYATSSTGSPLVGYSSASELSNATDYISTDLGKVLYVKAGFPLGYEFITNKEYDITLGIGSAGSSGGVLLADYFVDKDGVAVTLTKDTSGDKETVEVPDIDEGDDIFSNSTDEIDITVSACDWDDENNSFSL